MIVVTGASGKTGQALVRALAAREQSVRALVHGSHQIEKMQALGAREALALNLYDREALTQALHGARAVYLICPNMSPDEIEVSQSVIEAVRRNGVERLVYHSVLHPQVEAMPHHWAKMRVEELLFTSQLDFTILQPCAYMQNVQGYWQSITQKGLYPLPYAVEARISVVDLEDLADVAARVLCESGHSGAIYELAGPEALSQSETAAIISEALRRPVEARAVGRAEWARAVRASGMDDYAVETLLKMFVYYEQYGFTGCSRVLEGLLGRHTRTFREYIHQLIKGGESSG
jgi:NAD(P)H dehydrogenase (quinone)